jgi:hypothetical protein
MMINRDGSVRFLDVAEHLHYQPIILWNEDHIIRLSADKQMPFALALHHAENLYIDLFAIRFGHKEHLRRRAGTGFAPIQYGCSRAVRDEILLLPPETIIQMFSHGNCYHQECQYWSHPTGVKSKYAINCILARYMVMNSIDLKSGLTLEEVSRVFKCTRERIRQIEEKAMRRMRHHTRKDRFQDFQERAFAYQTYSPVRVEEIA